MNEENAQEEPKAAPTRPGCIVMVFLTGCMMLAGGVFIMGRWDAHGGAARAGAVVLVVIGTLLVLPQLAIWTLQLVLRYYIGKAAKGIGDAIGDMIEQNKQIYAKVHEFRMATEEDMENADRPYYESIRTALEESGFRHVGDIIDGTIEEIMKSPPVRVMVSADGLITAGAYSVPITPGEKADEPIFKRVLDLETEFTGGTFLCTSNAPDAGMISMPESVERHFHPPETIAASLISNHRASIERVMAERRDVSALQINTLEEAMESQKRLHALKCAFREQLGHLSGDEVRQVGEKGELDPMLAEMTAKAAEIAVEKLRSHQKD